MGWAQAHAASALRLSSGPVSRVVRGLRFPDARPIPMPGCKRAGCGRPVPGVLPFWSAAAGSPPAPNTVRRNREFRFRCT